MSVLADSSSGGAAARPFDDRLVGVGGVDGHDMTSARGDVDDDKDETTSRSDAGLASSSITSTSVSS